MTRRRHLPRLLAAVSAVAVLGALLLASAAGALCAPLLGPCAPPASGLAPAVAVRAATGVTPTGALLQGVVNPNGLATTYAFDYALVSVNAIATTAAAELPAGTSPQTVSARVTGLRPDSAYAVALVAENARGQAEAAGSLRTPTEIIDLAFSHAGASRVSVGTGTAVTLTARLAGPVALYDHEFGAPRAHLVSRPRLPALSLGGLAGTSVTADGVARFLPVVPERNTRFQIRVGSRRSRWVTVFVTPATELYSARVAGDPGLVSLSYTAGGALRPPARGPVVYFYRAAGPRGPFRRIGSARMRRSRFLLQASLTVGAPPGAFFAACTRRRIIPTMGRAFIDYGCGRERLR